MFRFSEHTKKKERKKTERKNTTCYHVQSRIFNVLKIKRVLFLNNSKRHSFTHGQGLQLLMESVSSLETTSKGVPDSRGSWLPVDIYVMRCLILGYLWLDTHQSTEPSTGLT